MAITVLSTDQVRPAERAGYWSDIIWRSFGRLRSDTYGDEDFSGHISQREFGAMRLSRLDASRHRVVRTAGNRGPATPATSSSSFSIAATACSNRTAGAHGELGAAQPGGRSITEIAFAWGFSSPKHFSRIFRARYGASPRDWRLSRRPS